MKALLVFAMTQLKRFLRDPMYLFFTFIFPLIFLFIFGNLYGGNDNVSFKVAIFNSSDSQMAKSFVEKFDSDESQKTFKVNKDLKTLDEAKEKMSRGELDSIIELPAEFGTVKGGAECADPANAQTSDCLPSGEMAVYYDPGQAQTGQTVATIMNGIVDEVNQSMTGATDPITVKQVSTGVEGMSTFDYVFAGLFAFTLMSMSIYGLSNQLPAEKKTGALRRLKATPFKPWQLIIGLSLVYTVMATISATVMVMVGVTMFDWQMRGQWLVFILFSLLAILMLNGFGMLIAGAAKNENQSTMASQLIAFPMMFLSGVFIPLYIMPAFFQTVSSFVPLTPVAEGLRFITTEGAGFMELLPQLGIMAVWAVVIYFAAFKAFRWE